MNTIEAYKYLLEAPGVNAVSLGDDDCAIRLTAKGLMEFLSIREDAWISRNTPLGQSDYWQPWHFEPKEKSNEEIAKELYHAETLWYEDIKKILDECDRRYERKK